MAKDGFYFSHDFSARNDTKLQKIIRKKGMAGVGLFWCLVELLYEENGYLFFKDIDDIAFSLRIKPKEITEIVENFEAFKRDEQCFWSESVLERLEFRNQKSKKAKDSVNKRWEKERTKYERIENVLSQSLEGNTIKNSKEEYNKEENSIVKETKAPTPSLSPQSDKVWNDMPLPADVPDIPPDGIITSAIKMVEVAQRVPITRKDALDYWEAWKTQHLSGSKHYRSLHEVHSHFINCIKGQRFNVKNIQDETRKQSLSPNTQRLLDASRSVNAGQGAPTGS